MNEEIREAIVLGFRGIEELAAIAGRRETRGSYEPESLKKAEACLATALDKLRLAKALVGDEQGVSASETVAAKPPVHHLEATEA
jgi:hypothetical protein